jgi:hypothetical protein
MSKEKSFVIRMDEDLYAAIEDYVDKKWKGRIAPRTYARELLARGIGKPELGSAQLHADMAEAIDRALQGSKSSKR